MGEKIIWLAVFWFSTFCCQGFIVVPERFRPSNVPKPNSRGSSLGLEAHSPSAGCDIVLFGLGDLRVDDHGGLHQALLNSKENNSKLLPLCVLDDKSLSCLPGSVAHTADTAQCLHHALKDLTEELESRCLTSLQFAAGKQNLVDCILDVCTSMESSSTVRLHVCDLGPADNQIGYGPYAQLRNIFALLPDNVELVPWTQDLRQEPWENVNTLPRDFTTYEKRFASQKSAAAPIDIMDMTTKASVQLDTPPLSSVVPTAEELAERMTNILSKRNQLLKEPGRVAAEQGSGLYMTHWGGLPSDTIGCRATVKVLDSYAVACDKNDALWVLNPAYPARRLRRNGRSLEHASMNWQLEGDGRLPAGNVENWMAGESVTRFLTAPLLLGTISPRRIWWASQHTSASFLSFMSPLKRMVESREWHRLLAARNMACDPAYQTSQQSHGQATTYQYWRYQGFLCRYAITPMSDDSLSNGKDGILLVHGFGASGTQWNKAMRAISEQQKKQGSSSFQEGLALDLLGFGEAEKPAISYTGYLWDAQVGDFVKERAITCHNWKSFVLGGNSIGGFTSMSAAACDSAKIPSRKSDITVTSSGAPGTGWCAGLVLMNSAGPIKSAKEVEEERIKAEAGFAADPRNKLPLYSIAQVTASDALPMCKPPLRPFTRVFGNTLLHYLRPRIQSICVNLYPTNPAAVDDALCDSIERDSLDPGAINVMMAGAKLPVPRTANELLDSDFKMGVYDGSTVAESRFVGPVLVAQGVLDPLNDAKDRLQRFGALRKGITMDPLQAGHCPHDEQPELVAASILKWKRDLASKSVGKVAAGANAVSSFQ